MPERVRTGAPVVETALLLIAVFGTWAYTSYEATFLDAHRQVTKW